MSLLRGCHSYEVTLLGGRTLYSHDVLQSPIKHREARSVDTPVTFIGLDIKQESIASEESSMTDDSMYTTENDDDSDDEDNDDDDNYDEDVSKGTKNL